MSLADALRLVLELANDKYLTNRGEAMDDWRDDKLWAEVRKQEEAIELVTELMRKERT